MKSLSQNFSKKKQTGFTLVETLLYIVMAGIILLVTSEFLTLLLHSRIKNQTISEVGQQGIHIMQILKNTIHNADGINSPLPQNTVNILSIDSEGTTSDPTLVRLDNGTLSIQEGSSSALPLTSSRIIASNLSFTNVSRTDTPDIIRISFTLTHINPEGRNEYDFSRTFQTSFGLR